MKTVHRRLFVRAVRGGGGAVATLGRRLGIVLFGVTLACSATPDRDELGTSATPERSPDAGTPPPTADRVEIIKGVPDRGRDPSVVAIDIGGEGFCSGALVSPRLVLTAR